MFCKEITSSKEDLQLNYQIPAKFVKFLDDCSNLLGMEISCYKTKGKDAGKLADESNSTTIDLYKLYAEKDLLNEKYQIYLKYKLENLKPDRSSSTGTSKKRNSIGLQPVEVSFGQVDLQESVSQLYLEVKKIKFEVNDRFDLYFQIYNEITKQYISEPFVVGSKESDISKLKNSVIFRDMEKKDYDSKLYLVCKCFRVGDFKRLEKKNNGNVKRPHGVALCPLSPLMLRSLVDGEHITETLTFYSCKEELFYRFHQHIIENAAGQNLQDLSTFERMEWVKSPLQIKLRLFERKYHELVQEDESIKSVSVVDLYKLPETIEISSTRNELYLTLNHVYLIGLGTKLLKKTDMQYRNLLVKVRAFYLPEKTNVKGSGDPVLLTNAISVSGENLPEYSTTVFSHVPNPTYNETVRLSLNPQQIERIYLVFTFFKVSTKKNLVETTPFGFGFTKLLNHNGLVGCPNQVSVFKYEKNIEMTLESLQQDEEKKSKIASKSFIDVRLNSCSVKIPSNEMLKDLFRLRDAETLKNESSVALILKNFSKVRVDGTVMNHFKQILDYVCPVFDLFSDEILLEDAFKSVVCLLHAIAHIPRFKDYKTVFADYCNNSLHSTLAWKVFIKFILKALDGWAQATNELTEILKTMSFLMHLIYASRKKFEATRKDDSVQKKAFVEDIMKTLVKFVEIIRAEGTSTRYLQLKVILFVHIGNTFDFVTSYFEFKEASKIVMRFLENVKVTRQTEHLLTVIDGIISGDLLKTSARDNYLEHIVPCLCEILDDTSPKSEADKSFIIHDRYKRVVRIVVSLMNQLEDVLHSSTLPVGSKTYLHLFNLLPSLSSAFDIIVHEKFDRSEHIISSGGRESARVDKFLPVKRDIISTFVAYLHIMSSSLLATIEKDSRNHVTYFFKIINVLLSRELVPEKWISYNLYVNQSIYNALTTIATALEGRLADQFSVDQWSEFFALSFKFAKLKFFQIEERSSRIYRRKVLENGDYRIRMLDVAKEKWIGLKVNQNHFIPSLIDYLIPAFEVINNDQARSTILGIYVGMLNREFQLQNDIILCEGETQKCLVQSNMDPDLTKSLIKDIEKRFLSEPTLKTVGPRFIRHLYELLSSISEVARYDDTEEDLKTDACIRVMNSFLKHSNIDLYFCYLYKLSEMHQVLNNFSESANCLLLYANRLKFTEPKVLPFFAEKYPQQPERERKEHLYKAIIGLFDKDTDWENAIRYSKELIQHYEDNYEYMKTKEYLTFIGECYENIMAKNRSAKSYYFVEVFGKKAEDKGKYIFKEDKTLISNFVEKLKRQRPDIEIAKNQKDDVLNAHEGIILRVNSVAPASAYEMKNTELKIISSIPPQILEYYSTMNVFNFKKMRLYNTYEEKYRKKPKNEYKHLCREVIFYTIDSEVSLIRRKNPVLKIAEVIMNPLQNATADLNEKIKEVSTLIIRKRTRGLERVLTGTIDAAVAGGESHYIDAFFSNKAIKGADTQTVNNLESFRKALRTHVDLLYDGLQYMRSVKNQNDLVDYLVRKLKDKEKNLSPIFLHHLNPELIQLTLDDMKEDEMEQSIGAMSSSFRLNVIPTESITVSLLSPRSSFSMISPRTTLSEKISVSPRLGSQGNIEIRRDSTEDGTESHKERNTSSGNEDPELLTVLSYSVRKSGPPGMFDDLDFITRVDDPKIEEK